MDSPLVRVALSELKLKPQLQVAHEGHQAHTNTLGP